MEIAIYLILILIALKIGLSFGILPQTTILIFALIGTKYGFIGFIIGALTGYIFTLIVGTILPHLANIFDIGLFKKKDRRIIAEKFYNEYKQEILSLEKFKLLNEDKIIDTFAKYIN